MKNFFTVPTPNNVNPMLPSSMNLSTKPFYKQQTIKQYSLERVNKSKEDRVHLTAIKHTVQMFVVQGLENVSTLANAVTGDIPTVVYISHYQSLFLK